MQFKALEEKLGYVFKNQKLLELALIHKSSNNISNNERLEFLGDTILDFDLTLYLFNNFPNLDEGNLTKIRSRTSSSDEASSVLTKFLIS